MMRVCTGHYGRSLRSIVGGRMKQQVLQSSRTVWIPAKAIMKQMPHPFKDMGVEEAMTYGDRVYAHPKFYSAENIMADKIEDDIKKVYSVREEDVEQIPGSLKDTLADDYYMAGPCLLYRRSTHELIEVLKEIEENAERSAKGSSVGIHGRRGVGKTVLLHQLAQYAVQKNWLLLGTKGEEFPHDVLGFIKKSETREGIFNQNRYAQQYLKQLLENKGDLFEKVTLKQSGYDTKYDWQLDDRLSKENAEDRAILESRQVGTTVKDLLTLASRNREVSAELMYDFVDEVINAEIPVLVLVDNANFWDQTSEFRNPDNAFLKIPCRQLSMVDAFSRFTREGPKNGASFFAMTNQHTLQKFKTTLEQATFEYLVEKYDDEELECMSNHYYIAKLQGLEPNCFTLARSKGLTGAVPRDVFFDACVV